MYASVSRAVGIVASVRSPGLLAAVFVGGVLGGLARAGLVRAIPYDPGAWPWATFGVNVAGAFLLGWAITRLQERLPISAYPRPLIGTGFCGALTTFATLQVELLDMVDAGRSGLALAYAATSVAAGFAAVLLAANLARGVRL